MELDLGVYPDCCMAYGLFEVETTRVIRRLLRPGMHFVDGGANLGYFTLLAADCVGPTGRVDAFEPQPEILRRLKDNLQRNGMTGIANVHELALSNEDGQAVIHQFDDADHNHGCASLFDAHRQATATTPVPTVRLDRMLAGDVPDLIKLDLEGAEALAIEGMAELLQGESPPKMILEHSRWSAWNAGAETGGALAKVRQLQPRYRAYEIGSSLRPLTGAVERLETVGEVNLLLTCE